MIIPRSKPFYLYTGWAFQSGGPSHHRFGYKNWYQLVFTHRIFSAFLLCSASVFRTEAFLNHISRMRWPFDTHVCRSSHIWAQDRIGSHLVVSCSFTIPYFQNRLEWHATGWGLQLSKLIRLVGNLACILYIKAQLQNRSSFRSLTRINLDV